jgi:hypothetical protein
MGYSVHISIYNACIEGGGGIDTHYKPLEAQPFLRSCQLIKKLRYKSPPLNPILSHINPTHNFTSYFFSLISLYLHLNLPSVTIPQDVKQNFRMYFSIPRVHYLTHQVLLDLITLRISLEG